LAAEYGLSLLESNEELHLEIESLKIQHEAETAELAADRDLYRRRHELALHEIDSWRSESKRLEEGKYQLSAELEALASRCECRKDGSNRPAFQRQQQRINELEMAVAELTASDVANTALISALKEWKAVHETQQKEKASIAFQETTSEKLYLEKLEQDKSRLKQRVETLQSDKRRLEELLAESEDTLKVARTEIDELYSKVQSKEREMHAQAELLLTAESKCGRLERERAIMEQVANLPVAVFDRDDDNDDDEDDDEDYDAPHATYSMKVEYDDEQTRNSEDPSDEEEWFTQKRTGSSSSARHGAMTPVGSKRSHAPVAANNQRAVPATPSSQATNQKLHHYFHLTALSIIHENNLHERCFDSSSRATVDTWYQEVQDQGVQFLEWHAWLISRIGKVAAAMQKEEQALERSMASRSNSGKTSGSSNSPFRAFMRMRENSKAQEPPPHLYGYAPSPPPPPTPRVSSSVAWSFFSRLMGRRGNQSHSDTDE
jgi:hypothetical protein